jgi:hypothetical protein
MENFFLSFMVGVLQRTNIYVNLKNYNYIKVEPLIPYTFMILLGHKSQHVLYPQDLNMFCPQDLSFIEVYCTSVSSQLYSLLLMLVGYTTHYFWNNYPLSLRRITPLFHIS